MSEVCKVQGFTIKLLQFTVHKPACFKRRLGLTVKYDTLGLLAAPVPLLSVVPYHLTTP